MILPHSLILIIDYIEAHAQHLCIIIACIVFFIFLYNIYVNYWIDECGSPRKNASLGTIANSRFYTMCGTCKCPTLASSSDCININNIGVKGGQAESKAQTAAVFTRNHHRDV